MALVIVAGLTWTFYNAGFSNFLAFMPTYLAAHGHSRAVANLVVSIATWGALPAIIAGGTLGAAFGPNRVFMVGAVMSSVSVAGLGLLDWPLVWGTLFGTLASIHAGVIVAVGTLSTRPQHRAVGMAIFYTTYYLGGTIIPAFCGHAADLYGDPAGAFLCAGAFSALAIPCYWLHQRMQAAQ
jgi:MFS family permease